MEGDRCFSGNPSASCLFLFDSCSTSFFLASHHSWHGVSSSLIAFPHPPPQHKRVLCQRSVEPVHIQAFLQHVRGIPKVCECVSWGCHTMIQLWVQHLVYTQCMEHCVMALIILGSHTSRVRLLYTKIYVSIFYFWSHLQNKIRSHEC